jgi:hypothetical protein
VPVILLTLAFAWWFRAGNKWARRAPDWAYSGPVEVTVWSIPTLVILFLGGIAWIGSHDLDPGSALWPASAPPLEVQVVSLDWKWLFIYPDLGVASVNRLVVPAGTPLRLHLTSASVMNSFFVPQLGSQIYTMAGMTTTLHLQAEQAPAPSRDCRRSSAATVSPTCASTPSRRRPAAFTQWVAGVHAGAGALDAARYAQLARPGVAASTPTYGQVAPGLFQSILATSVQPPVTTERGRCNDMLGKLTWDAIPLHDPIPLFAAGLVVFMLVGVLALVTVKGWWPVLWRDWITSVDHKRIGVMYMLLALVMLVRGFVDALMMRTQLALAAGHAQGYLPPEHYDQIFSAHGTIMIFFVAMTFMVGLMNFVVPLQIGARDVAFPVLNSVSFWLTAAGVLLVNVSLVVGEFARTGWLAYPPLSELAYSPGRGRRLLPVVAADLGRGHAALGHQPHHHHPEDAHAGHGLFAACPSSPGLRWRPTC